MSKRVQGAKLRTWLSLFLLYYARSLSLLYSEHKKGFYSQSLFSLNETVQLILEIFARKMLVILCNVIFLAAEYILGLSTHSADVFFNCDFICNIE